MRKTLVLKGWATEDTFYRDMFEFPVEFDPKMIDKDEEINVIAWSMGTLKAFEISRDYNVKKMVLISPTRDFLMTMPLVVVKRMEKGIKRNKKKIIEDFIKLNFNKEEESRRFEEAYLEKILEIDDEELLKGLEYLRSTKVPETIIETETLVCIGSEDGIIPVENTVEAVKSIKNKKIKYYDKGHNLLFENIEFIDDVRSFLID